MNRLGSESSPYLLQHKNNPVWWYAWGPAAFEAAKRENKPIFLSIGYSTCYWCHVMEHDSFEREEVANVLNQNYIAIKVDREERPDVDQIYMDAVAGLTGHGGWPLSVFLTPQLKPFWGGTFFYRQQFIQILEALQELWKSGRERVLASSEEISEALSARAFAVSRDIPGKELLIEAIERLSSVYEPKYGGFSSAPKFPPSQQVSLLFRIVRCLGQEDKSKQQQVQRMALHTLECMARGGMFDHLAGGFHRYSTDERWLVPHFEKMLYDNALLAVTYLEAAQVTEDNFYKGVAEDTLAYVLRVLCAPDGGFYSAQDAGDVGREGEYYVWKYDQLSGLLDAADCKLICDNLQVTPGGNFEGGANVLSLAPGLPWEAKRTPQFKKVKERLLEIRSRRKCPAIDTKIIAAWNGLMLSALSKAFAVLGSDDYRKAAVKCAQFLEQRMWDGQQLSRSFADGRNTAAGCLDDYAFLVAGLIDLYQVTFDHKWYRLAREIQTAQDRIFWDKREGGYYYSSAQELIIAKKDIFDNAVPSGNSAALCNLIRLEALSCDLSYRQRAEELLRFLAGPLKSYTAAFPKALQGLIMWLSGVTQIAVVAADSSEKAPDILTQLGKQFLPEAVLAFGTSNQASEPAILRGKRPIGEGSCSIYLCRNNTCEAPVENSVEAVEKFLRKLTVN